MKSWQKKIKRILFSLILIFAILFIVYNYNLVGSKQAVVNYQNSYTVNKSNKQISWKQRKRIRSQLMRETQKKEGLTKQGFVSIPRVGILEPIFNSAYTSKGLAAGANYANQSVEDPQGNQIPIMGKGNYGLASHNFNDGRTGFSGLQQYLNEDKPYYKSGKTNHNNWLDGSRVYLANEQGIYAYSIFGQNTVAASDISVLNPTAKAHVTIISCLFPSIRYRIITQGRLQNTYSWRTAPSNVVHYFDLTVQKTNAHASWYNPGTEEGVNGDAGGTRNS